MGLYLTQCRLDRGLPPYPCNARSSHIFLYHTSVFVLFTLARCRLCSSFGRYKCPQFWDPHHLKVYLLGCFTFRSKVVMELSVTFSVTPLTNQNNQLPNQQTDKLRLN